VTVSMTKHTSTTIFISLKSGPEEVTSWKNSTPSAVR
jgi:hypothetical protein